jgi:hypothetical protein
MPTNYLSKLNVFAVVIAVIFGTLSLTAWSISSPVGAGPDDDFHLASVWCGKGTNDSLCKPGRETQERYLPTAFSQSNCFALNPEISASCQGKNFGIDANSFGYTKRGNFTGDYPPLFYFVMSQFASENLDASVLIMRIFNSFLLIFLTLLTFLVVVRNLRVPLLIGIISTSVPLGIFVVTSLNPSSWVIISACLLWPLLVTFFSSTGKRKIFSLLLSILLVVMATGSRADGGIFSLLACVFAMILTFKNKKSWWKQIWIFVLIASLGLVAVVFSHQANAANNGLGAGDIHANYSTLILANLVELPGLLTGIFGTWGLGWLDTEMPSSVWVSSIFVFGALVFTGMSYLNIKKALAASIAFIFVVSYPMALLALSKSYVGSNVQPRYVLPLIIMFAGVIFIGVTESKPKMTRAQTIIGGALVWVAFTIALHINIRRYVTGIDVLGINLSKDAEWWWTFGPTPMAVWLIGSFSFGILLSVLISGYLRLKTDLNSSEIPSNSANQLVK